MKRILAAGATAGLLAVALFVGSRQPLPSVRSAAAESVVPQDTVERMFSAAERGDVDAYLACFSGQARELLDRQLSGQSRDEFSQTLRASVAELKGWVVKQSVGDPDSVLVVERIYAHRMERQKYQLVRESRTWLINSVGQAEPFQPDVPYGTPVWQAKDEAEAEYE